MYLSMCIHVTLRWKDHLAYTYWFNIWQASLCHDRQALYIPPANICIETFLPTNLDLAYGLIHQLPSFRNSATCRKPSRGDGSSVHELQRASWRTSHRPCWPLCNWPSGSSTPSVDNAHATSYMAVQSSKPCNGLILLRFVCWSYSIGSSDASKLEASRLSLGAHHSGHIIFLPIYRIIKHFSKETQL